ncbi:MAG: hypothetical protein QNK30_15230, partial [Bacteroidales bacterium]|nr:hypothetical protein [Bacteroidales bacterium]
MKKLVVSLLIYVLPLLLFGQTYTISVNISPVLGGSAIGAGDYTSGQTANLLASPNTGYSFVNWTSGATVLATTPAFDLLVESDSTVV